MTDRRSGPRAGGFETERGHADGVAIIGMACVFPGAPNVDAYWRNILGKVDAVTDAPPEAWNPSIFYDPTFTDTDKVYTQRGGYLGALATFDPLPHGIPPITVGGEPDQWLALQTAHDAMADAGCLELPDEVRRRTAIVLGKGAYLNGGNAISIQRSLVIGQTLEIIRRLHPEYSDADIELLRTEMKRALPSIGPETVPGLIPNVTVGRIANRLDLMGPSYTVDAACASSLVAVQLAMRDLTTGACDLALAGGSQVWMPVPTLNVFCQLGALSRREQIRPFDRDADGTLLGEGIGMVVLKRLADAERDGDRIYAVVRAVGVSSDGRGASVMAPRVEGEAVALRRAYDEAGVDPASVALIEAHGTATAVGDVVEVQALTRVFGERPGDLPRCALGTVKSMISHTIPAAGVAGLIKTSLALYHKVLPPTINCDEPNPKLELEKTPFYINTETRPWIHGGHAPRRAGVNAFGFGGINAHAVLEEYVGRPVPEPPDGPIAGRNGCLRHLPPWDSEVCILEAESPGALLDQARSLLDALPPDPVDGELPAIDIPDLAGALAGMVGTHDVPCRLAIVATSLADLRAKLHRASERLAGPRCHQIKDVSGTYYFAQPLAREGKLAFLFPGEGAQYPDMLADLCLHFPEVRACFDRSDRIFVGHPRGYLPSDYIYPRPAFSDADRRVAEARLMQMDVAIEAVLTANQALLTLIGNLGVRPDVCAGHSTGEYSALTAAGALDVDSAERLAAYSRALNAHYEVTAADNDVPRAALLALGTERETARAVAAEAGGDVFLAMDNCPHQVVLVGARDAVERARLVADREGLIYEWLAFDRAYHTPLFAPYTDGLRRSLERVAVRDSHTSVYSCATASRYPVEPGAVRDLLVEQWARPVEFRAMVEALYAEGVRVFVEVGPRGNLSAFVEDTLRGRPHAAVPANVRHRSGITQLNHLVGLLAAHGANLDLAYLYARRQVREVNLDAGPLPAPVPRSRSRVHLFTTWQPLRLDDAVAERLGRPASTVVEPLASPPASPSPVPVDAPATPALEYPRYRSDAGPAAVPGADEGTYLPAASPWVVAAPPVSDDAGTGTYPPDTDAAIHDYLDTMDQFLVVQEHVLQAFLGGPVPGVDEASVAGSSMGVWYGDEWNQEPSGDARPQPDDGVDVRADEVLTPNATMRIDPAGWSMAASPGDSGRGTEVAGASPVHGVASDRHVAGADLGPLLGTVIVHTPGRELVARREFHPNNDRYLRDHTLGRDLSVTDPDLLGLPVMPLTMSLEMLTEAAAALVPAGVVVGLRDVRAHRWLVADERPQVLEVTARRLDAEAGRDRVAVRLRNLTEDEGSATSPRAPVVEALVLLAGDYPPAPRAVPPQLLGGRASRWTPERLYTEAMFHGPAWQGVTAIQETGPGGIVARMRVLPVADFLSGIPRPGFTLDPVMLDAAGQLVGFWTMEHLASAAVVFPYSLEAMDLFGPPHPVGHLALGSATIRLIGDRQVSSDIDVIDDDGRLWMRLSRWEDWRFDLPPRFRPLLGGADRAISTAWVEPLGPVSGDSGLACRRVSTRFPSDQAFWMRVWADGVLSRAEREEFRRLRLPEARRLEWLGARTAAKDAVRALLETSRGLHLRPADVVIATDPWGRPVVAAAGAADVMPAISLAHTDGCAVALARLAGEGSIACGIGLDIERLRPRPDGFDELAFTDAERTLLGGLPDDRRDEWTLRCWCAKEAVGKAVGRGLVEGPRSVTVVAIDLARESLTARLAGRLAREVPDVAADPFIVYTRRVDDLVTAITVDRAG